jgi:hypothetical protein
MVLTAQPLPLYAVKWNGCVTRFGGEKEPARGAASGRTAEMAIWLHLGVLAVEMAIYAAFALGHVVPTPVGYAVMALCKLASIGLLVLDMSRRNGTSRGYPGS